MFIVVDGSSVVTTNYFATLPKEILYKSTEAEREPLYEKLLPKNADGEYDNAVEISINQILGLTRIKGIDHAVVCFDRSRDTFRRAMYPEYKANRPESPAPLKSQTRRIERMLQDRYGIATLSDDVYEADDLAGSLVKRYSKEQIVLYTKDHDWLQLVSDRVFCLMRQKDQQTADRINSLYKNTEIPVPGRTAWFTPETVVGEIGVRPEQIPDLKGLSGDTADNIPGVRGVSSVTAVKLLKKYPDIEHIYYDLVTRPDTIECWKKEIGVGKAQADAIAGQMDGCFLSRTLATIVDTAPIRKSFEEMVI